jgi:hypothetical protein
MVYIAEWRRLVSNNSEALGATLRGIVVDIPRPRLPGTNGNAKNGCGK